MTALNSFNRNFKKAILALFFSWSNFRRFWFIFLLLAAQDINLLYRKEESERDNSKIKNVIQEQSDVNDWHTRSFCGGKRFETFSRKININI